jgi:DNA-binding winged helix-turn-helix (wHTH) protein/tetratricopeptide (TPR) repeat protein/TolB-like protein
MRGASELPLRRQSFEVLRYLAEHAGKVVSNEELIKAVWLSKPADHTSSVGQCIKEIRRAIGDDARWIIQTVSGHGYEFKAEVVRAGPPQPYASGFPEIAANAGAPSGMHAVFALSEGRRRTILAAAVALAVALAICGWLIWTRLGPASSTTHVMMASPTIAVLPFAVLGSEDGQRSHAARLEAEIRSELARAHRGFDLIIRPAADDRDRSLSPKVTASRLGARYVVTGTTWLDLEVQRANVQLTDTETDRQIWSEPFELYRGQNGDFNRMVARIARLLIIQVRTAESGLSLPAKVEAGQYALLGRALHETERGAESTRKAQSLFKKALELDSNSVPALQGFATTKLIQVHNGWIAWEQRSATLTEAGDAIERLVKLDPRNAAGHYLRASLSRALGEVEKAIASLEYALSLNPNYYSAHAELGRIKIEAGRAQETIGHIQQALQLSPPEPNIHVWYYWAGMAALYISDDRAAVSWLLKARQANPSFRLSARLLAVAYLGIGEEEAARASLAEYLKEMPNFSIEAWNRFAPPTRSRVVVKQRERIMDAWRRLGVPEDDTPVASR